MATSRITYKGELRTEAVHLASEEVIISDAPVDNNGRGMAFSPTDTLATSLASCMLTVMGIYAEKNDLPFQEASAEVTKTMGNDPRRVIQIDVDMRVSASGLSDRDMKVLEGIGRNCPVAKSLSPEIKQKLTLNFF